MAALPIIGNIKPKQRVQILKVVTHIGALFPLIWLYIDYYTYNLGADEINAAILRTGYPALVLLVLSLACTPLNILFGWKSLLPLRKPLGLYGFMYVALHLAIFAIIDFGGDVGVVWTEIVERRYALAGFASFIILVPLAATSTKWAQRKLGKRWKTLHRLSYVAVILGIVHYLWLVRNDYNNPIMWATILGLGLILRYDPIKKRITKWRKSLKKRRKAA